MVSYPMRVQRQFKVLDNCVHDSESEVLKLWATLCPHSWVRETLPHALVCYCCPHSSLQWPSDPRSGWGPLCHCNNHQLAGGARMLPLIQVLDQVACISGLLQGWANTTLRPIENSRSSPTLRSFHPVTLHLLFGLTLWFINQRERLVSFYFIINFCIEI